MSGSVVSLFGLKTKGKVLLISFFSVIVLMLAFVGFNQATAQNPAQISLTVTPTVFELATNGNEAIDQSFKLINTTDRELQVRAIPKNFVAEGEEGGVNLTEDVTSFSLASWIDVEPKNAVISANGSQVFAFTINVPNDAEPGGHFGSIIVQTEAVNIDETGPAVSQEVGPLILLDVAGSVKEEASIVDFGSEKSLWEGGPVVLNTRVENTGSVHFKPKGTIVIKDMFGSEKTTINLEEKNVLPSSIRKLTSEWDPGFTIGKYTADLSLVYGNDDVILNSSTSFIIFPYKVVVPILVVIGGFIFVLFRYRQRFAEAIKVLSGKA